MPDLYSLAQKQILPLEAKVRLAMMRIRAWDAHWCGEGVVMLVEGGNSSEMLVLSHVVREVLPDIEAVVVVESGHRPITAFRVGSDEQRRADWLLYGCNAFDALVPECRPLSVWTDDDVRDYLKLVRANEG